MRNRVIPCCVLAGWLCAPTSLAQETKPATAPAGEAVKVIQTSPSGEAAKVIELKAGQVIMPGQPTPADPHGPKGERRPDGQPPRPDQPPGAPGTPTPDKPGEAPKEAPGSGTVKRPEKPAAPPDPEELKVRPDKDGLVRFQFRGQSWTDVLEWFGEISGMSVDWQELPGDYLNIATQRGYTVDEIRDLLNRHLLARGYTLLRQDEFLIVVKCDQLSAGLVPQVTLAQLDELSPHEYVRVLFELDWILADEVAEELEPLLSKNGKLFAMSATNRVEAMDAVANLREIRELLNDEQKVENGEPRLVREFVLLYARAQDIKDQLSQLLGSTTSNQMPMAGMTPEQMQQQQQMMQQQMQMQMQMQQQQQQMQQGQPGQPPGQPPRVSARPRRGGPVMGPKEDPVRMIVNRRRNSILVQAPPNKMAIIADAVRLLDVQDEGSRSLQAYLGRMQVYRLAQLDPQKLVASLQELGGLDPTTRLEVDPANRAIIAYASPADHFTIRSTIEKLDSSARHVEVIPLRRLAADEVAGTIQNLMGNVSERQGSRSDYMDYMYGGYSFGRRGRGAESEDQFRIEADVANNRLLVRANDVELEEVVSILVKLGEMPREAAGSGMTRVLNVIPGEHAAEFYQQLQRSWKPLAPNPLILPEVPPPTPTTDEPAPQAKPAATPPTEPASAPTVTQTRRPSALFRTALFQQPSDETASPAQPAAPVTPPASAPEKASPPSPGVSAVPPAGSPQTPAPVVVSVAPDGRLVISSSDAAALAMFEELAARLAPPEKEYTVFRLKNASATWIVLNLEDFFEDKDAKENRRSDRVMSFMYGMPSGSSQDSSRRLSQRRPLRFISDLDTNTILVQGADAEQLKTIKELIALYDVPEPVNSQKARVTKLISVKYSKAGIVAGVIKDAYRDLLSTNDRALQEGKQGRDQQRGGGMTVISPFGFGDQPQPADTRTSARFDGKLSIGVDDLSNTLLVSAEGDNLMTVIADMIEALDKAAMPVGEVRVVTLSKDTDGSRLSQALSRVLGNGSPTAPPQMPQAPPQVPVHPGGMPPATPAGAAPAKEASRGR
jgi:type II secretory pathway component GspD/PulD (secretin)